MILKKKVFFRVSEINECDGVNDCHDNATCTNTVGSHNCTCKEGFEGNGTYCIGRGMILSLEVYLNPEFFKTVVKAWTPWYHNYYNQTLERHSIRYFF